MTIREDVEHVATQQFSGDALTEAIGIIRKTQTWEMEHLAENYTRLAVAMGQELPHDMDLAVAVAVHLYVEHGSPRRLRRMVERAAGVDHVG